MLVTDSTGFFLTRRRGVYLELRHFRGFCGDRIVPRCCLSVTPFASVISYLLREWGVWGFHAGGHIAAAGVRCR